MKKILLPLLMAACCLLFSCKSKVNKTPGTALVWDSVVLDKVIRPDVSFADSTVRCHIYVKMINPISFGNDSTLLALRRLIYRCTFGDKFAQVSSAREALEKIVTQDSLYFMKGIEYTRSVWKEEEWGRFEDFNFSGGKKQSNEIKQKVCLITNSLLVYETEQFRYEGGAHGLLKYDFFNIDLDKMKRLSEKDIILPGKEETLNKLIQKKLIEHVKKVFPDKGEDFNPKEIFFHYNEIKANGNFQLSVQGIKYIYNPYEIAAYATGSFEIDIPYSELKNIIDADAVRRLIPQAVV